MKKRLVFVLFSFLFLLGSAGIDARGIEGTGEIIIVQGKDSDIGILVSPPLEYLDIHGGLSSPIDMEIYDVKTGQVVFAIKTFDKLICPTKLSSGNYLVKVDIGNISFQELVGL